MQILEIRENRKVQQANSSSHSFINLMVLLLTTFMLSIPFQPIAYGQTEDLKARVQSTFNAVNKAINEEDLDACMAFYHEDYSFLIANLDRAKIRKRCEELFDNYDKVRLDYDFISVNRFGRYIVSIYEETIKGKSAKEESAPVKQIAKHTLADLLVEVDGELKFYQSIPIDKNGMDKIKQNKYRNDSIGISLTMPEGWGILPVQHPGMMEMIFFRPPDGDCFGIYGYLELPYQATPKQAVESDDNMTKKLVDGEFEVLTAGEMPFKGYDAYESMTKFQLKKEEHPHKRRRVYFSAGGLLHVFTLDVKPAAEWTSFEADLNSILDSFRMSKEDGAQAARKEFASGSIIENIYVNEKTGCQVAAPEGWSIESTNIGAGAVFSINMKPDKDKQSLVRLIAWPFEHEVAIETIVEQQIKSYEAIGKDVVNSPSQAVQVNDIEAVSVVNEFTIEGFDRFKRKTVMFIANDFLFTFLCDAIPPSDYEALEPRFDEIIQSFTLN
ncbi:hypothetical protein GF373_06300 [bacterium]|nr:hypothetical protein [bacterium]